MRRRRRRMARPTAQQYFRQKMTKLFPVKSDLNTGNVRICFSLQNTTNGQDVNAFDSTTRWEQTRKNYESYAVNGLKLQWIPTNARGGVSQSSEGNIVQGTGSWQTLIHQAQLGNQSLWFDQDT